MEWRRSARPLPHLRWFTAKRIARRHGLSLELDRSDGTLQLNKLHPSQVLRWFEREAVLNLNSSEWDAICSEYAFRECELVGVTLLDQD